jgi:hypothetical protein
MPSETSALASENARLGAQLSALRLTIERDASDLEKMRRAKLSSEASLMEFETRLAESKGQANQLTA